MVRVRIAPSPTGIPHIGNTRTALFNYFFAKHNKGKFILRIEDTDRKRIVQGAKETIFEILDWLSLKPDEIYTQSERLSIYKKTALELLKKGLAHRDEGAIRFIVPKDRTIEWQDMIGGKRIKFRSESLEDFVILKSDGFPTYHLASVVDDNLMQISHVIRGDEWISSTPKHILLYEAFGFRLPKFAHLPVILGSDKNKLSKRNGAKSVLDYRDEGYLKEAIVNFMALLGWSPGEDREIMSLSEMIGLFDLRDVNTGSPVFDINKLTWLNGYYIRQLSINELKSKIKNQTIRQTQDKKSKIQIKIKKLDEKALDQLVNLVQTRMRTLNDFWELTRHFFEEPKIKLGSQEKQIAKELLLKFSAVRQPTFAKASAGEWNSKTILLILREIMIRYNIRMPTLYKIFTGKDSGLPLPASLEILGKEKTLKRLKGVI